MKLKYGAKERAQKLKYHIQTSGRSLHAQEIDFNDIRTTLQALTAIYDNCNSLHTNAYDEAITTPTEESARRALAIQMIINREFGLNKNENNLQGSYIISELTDLVEKAVIKEFYSLTDRGGVLGSMEMNYQRGKIQEESMYYEQKKMSGEYPIIGVNTFTAKESKTAKSSKLQEKSSTDPLRNRDEEVIIPAVTRSTDEEKENQISSLQNLHAYHKEKMEASLRDLQPWTLANKNIFEKLMHISRFSTLGKITDALYKSGGRYRRNL
jgi:methylmalonyl-CoA mutase